MTLSDLPLHMQNNILYKFSDACDIINLGQATPTLHMLSEDRQLWKDLCQFHFAEKQVNTMWEQDVRGLVWKECRKWILFFGKVDTDTYPDT